MTRSLKSIKSIYPNRIVWKNKQGQNHNEDGPAVEWHEGSVEWWINGKLHRVGGPAVEYADGTREWRLYDKLHRLNGPARTWAGRHKQWWVFGKHVCIY